MKAALALLLSLATVAVFSCNAILANDPGVLAITDEAGTEPAPIEPVTIEGGDVPTSPLVTPDAGNACPPGQEVCDGLCVAETDPLYGCGSPSCAPCAIAHGTASCQGGTCVVASCNKGYANCNANPADGCETDLTRATTCGGCNTACPIAAPFCAPSGGTFACTTGCTGAAPLRCGNDCVDPTSNVKHCGGCNAPCPAVAHATSACQARACTFTCKADFGDCNSNPADGCEAKVTDDPANCGACRHVCPADTTCKNASCRPGNGH